MKTLKSKSILLVICMALIFLSVTDAQVADQDGNTYKTVTIGTQEWMAENLNVSHFRNGDPIPEASNEDEWKKAAEEGQPAWCYYNYDQNYGEKYGKLYNWYAVNDPRGIAPQGWHVPSDAEWTQLTDFLGGENVAGTKMKNVGGWKSNESGFSGLPGGICYSSGEFNYAGSHGFWWTSTQRGAEQAWSRGMSYSSGSVSSARYRIQVGFSVRCVKD